MTKRRGHGEGSITRRTRSGLHMARYRVETPAGPKRKTIYGKTRKEVDAALAQALADRLQGAGRKGHPEVQGGQAQARAAGRRAGLRRAALGR